MPAGDRPGARRGGPRDALLLLAGFVLIALALYAPIMNAGWLSDDLSVIAGNPYVQELSLENLGVVLDPYGAATAYAFNYSPVHLLLHAVNIQLFGGSFWGHHFVNVLLHALTALLFVLLLRSSKLPYSVAAAAGFLFLVHPANAESVALIFQAKTTLSTALALGALLCFFRWPLASVALFGLALLTKITAVFALPGLFLLVRARRAEPDREVPGFAWVAAWAFVLVLVSLPELEAFRRTGQAGSGMGEGFQLARSIVGIAGRYLVMAASSVGVSPLHNPEPSASWLDPWFLAGCVALGLLGWRSARAFLRRDEEAAYWGMAAAGFFPVCQLFPFLYPMADRYLYTMLVGLLGGACLALRQVPAAWAPTAGWTRRIPGLARPGALVAAGLLVAAVGLGAVTSSRVGVFRTEQAMTREGARNYPNGIAANLRALQLAGPIGNAAAAAEAVRNLDALGFAAYNGLVNDAGLNRVARDPAYRAAIQDMAGYWIERIGPLEERFQIEYQQLAYSHLVREELRESLEAAEQGLALGGPHDADLRAIRDAAQAGLARRDSAEP